MKKPPPILLPLKGCHCQASPCVSAPMATICAGRLRQAIQQYPESNAVLVRRHGLYVWGKDWTQAKTQAECYDYLFEAALRMKVARH